MPIKTFAKHGQHSLADVVVNQHDASNCQVILDN